ncbi:unnamed protein product [Haemonchus placei]|uniref:Transcriptional regulator n=1 Tax=Haemonchus placei TaxID=6290 RepID=A0A0N4WCS1_HAEPC|nr:unnamed protein product [Haemonchus placei]
MLEVDHSDVESGLHEVMDLTDEMISFLTKEESLEAVSLISYNDVNR